MRAWLGSLVRGRWPEVALALAIGYAAVTLAQSAAELVTSVLAQHVGSNPFGEDDASLTTSLFNAPYLLNFDIGATKIFYGPVLAAALALGLVFLAAGYVVRRRDRELGMCPACVARIPHGSSHCAYCGSSTATGTPS